MKEISKPIWMRKGWMLWVFLWFKLLLMGHVILKRRWSVIH